MYHGKILVLRLFNQTTFSFASSKNPAIFYTHIISVNWESSGNKMMFIFHFTKA